MLPSNQTQRRDKGWRRALLARAALVAVGLGLSLTTPSPAAAGFDHSVWNELLQEHVDAGGRVAYRRLAGDGRGRLDAYLDGLARARPAELERKEQLAFWINAYNAATVAGILDGYQAESAFGRYRFFRSYEREIAGEKRTLDQIEHAIIRPTFGDFRAHFAVNCASTSCPVLRQEAYVGARLDAQLDDQARRFLQDASRNRFDEAGGVFELSRIFEWFAEDFSGNGKSLADNLGPYLSEQQRSLLLSKQPLRYLEYDWTMNAQPGQRP